MSVLELFNGAAAAAFTPSKPFLISGERTTLDFLFTLPAPGATLEWFLEFTSDDPNAAAARWAREVAEEDVGGGVTNMPLVLRNFAGIVNDEKRSCQFVRAHRFCRVQFRLAAASPAIDNVTILAPFGLLAQSPA